MILTVKALVVALLLGFSLLLLGLGLGMPIPGVAAMAAEAVLGLLLPPAAFPLFMAGAVCMLCLRPLQGGGNSVTGVYGISFLPSGKRKVPYVEFSSSRQAEPPVR